MEELNNKLGEGFLLALEQIRAEKELKEG